MRVTVSPAFEAVSVENSPRTRRRRRARVWSLVMAGSIAWLAAGAQAVPVAAPPEPPAATDDAQEAALIERGLAEREARKDATALETFRRAFELKHGARALAQMALAEQALGRWAPAEADLGHALAGVDDPWIARNKGLLNQALAEIQGHLGSLQLAGGVAGAEVVIDGASVARLPLGGPLRVNAGSVKMEVRAANYVPLARTVNVPKRGLVKETVALVAAGPSATPVATLGANGEASATKTSEPPSWSDRTKVGLALGGGAVVSAVLATTFLFVRDGRAHDFNEAGCATEALTPGCSDLRDKEASARAWLIGGAVGAVVLGGAAGYFLFWPRSHEPTAQASASGTRSVSCVPATSGAAAGLSLSCGGRF